MKKHCLNRTFLTADWRWLVMLNWEVAPELLADLVPNGTQLDFHDGKTYLSIVAFLFENTRLLGVLPVPFHRRFEELNLRFYVCRQENGERKRGVTFINELVPKPAIALVARRFYNENYSAVPMQHSIQSGNGNPSIKATYRWKGKAEWNFLRAEGNGKARLPVDGSIEQFIAEHYWGYSAQPDGSTLEYRVRHPSWKVWHADEDEFRCEIERLFGSRFVETLQQKPNSAFIADGSEISVSWPRRILPPSTGSAA